MLSIIVPIYNGQDYVEKCIYSILNQEYEDIEVICVNDGSTDDSLRIVSELAKKDGRIRIIHKDKNGGLVSARKTGINNARGKYATYVDCDDWVEKTMYIDMISYAEKYNVDIVTSGTIYEGKIKKTVFDGFEDGLYEGDKLDFIKNHIFFSDRRYEEGIRSNLVNKIYKTDMIRNIQNSISDSVSYGEDRLCTLKCLLAAGSVYVLHRAYYHYVILDNSMSNGDNYYYLDQIGSLYRGLLQVICDTHYNEQLKFQCGIYITQLLFKGINNNLGFEPEDMVWIHPSWMSDIPSNSRIILYGCGRRGKTYYRQLKHSMKNIEVVAWVDKNYKSFVDTIIDIKSPDDISNYQFDFIIISVENDEAAEEIKEILALKGVDKSKIMRPIPLDSFWQFAEYTGLYIG